MTSADDRTQRVRGSLRSPAGLLALAALPGVGPRGAIRLAEVFDTAEAYDAASPEDRRRVAELAEDAPLAGGRLRLTRVASAGRSGRVVGFFDAAYPAALREIADPPLVLWMRGTLPDPARRVAVVGTRTATAWGVATASVIAAAAAEAGVSVVSGLARGIDIAAHRAALAAGGHTIAVLGSGLDRISPPEHAADAERIVAAGGCVMTELPPGTPAGSRTLVARDRIQAGLAAATIVVQSGFASGTMATVRYTLEQGKRLVLPEPHDEAERRHPENAGSLALLADDPRRRLASRRQLTDLLAAIR